MKKRKFDPERFVEDCVIPLCIMAGIIWFFIFLSRLP